MRVLFSICAALFWTAQSLASPSDGNDLLTGIKIYRQVEAKHSPSASDLVTFAEFLAFIDGFTRGLEYGGSMSGNSRFTFPSNGVAPSQVIELVSKFLAEHPERLHDPATVLLIRILHKTFPNSSWAPPQN